jgi:hypothetical protein
VKFHSVIRYALALAASFLVAACGGGGASVNPNSGGILQLFPTDATIYAGIKSTFTVVGGQAPFALTSSDPGVLQVPATINSNAFDVVPNNPSTLDAPAAPGAPGIRTVTVFVHDKTGASVSILVHVAQNFLTGYGLIFGVTTCPPPTGTQTSVTPCAGGDTAVSFKADFNGSLHGNQPFQLDVVRGQFAFFDPISSTNTVTPSLIVNSDHNGVVNAIIRVPAGVPSQLAVVRITDPGTKVSTDLIFSIIGTSSTLTLTAIPSAITFTGALSTQCGTGSADVFIFDGAPPYSALSSNPNVTVSVVTASTQPGRFTITALNANVCLATVPVIFLDSAGNRVTVTVTTAAGSQVVPPPAALTVAPSTLTLNCGASSSVTVVGGSGSYSASSTSASVGAVVSGNTVTISRQLHDGGTFFPQPVTVTITDGATFAPVTVNTQFPGVPLTCP